MPNYQRYEGLRSGSKLRNGTILYISAANKNAQTDQNDNGDLWEVKRLKAQRKSETQRGKMEYLVEWNDEVRIR